jgi:hypothetical protein
MENQYKEQAQKFCDKNGVKISIELAKNQSAPLWAVEGSQYGLKYNIKIKRAGKKWIFNFWDSVHNKEILETLKELKSVLFDGAYIKGVWNDAGEVRKFKRENKPEDFQPTAYDVLACITKNETGSFDNFCSNYGCNNDSRKDLETFLAVGKEWENCERLFGDVMEELREIA